MQVKFHRNIITLNIVLLCLNGCYHKENEKFFPYKLPDAVVNQPYAVTLYNFAGYIDKNDIQMQIIPENNSFKMMTFNENDSAEIVKFIYTPKKIGQYNVSVTGVGQQRPFPSQFFNHNYSINVLDQSSICNYQGIIYNNSKETKTLKEFITLQNLPKAIISKEYHQQIILIPSNIKNDDLYKKDIQLVTYPKNSGLKIKPVHGDIYNIVELYGIPKVIGNIEIIFKRYKVNDPTITYEYKSYNLPVFPDLSNCPIK